MEENKYALTIAIPTYNRVEYLKKCVNSVLDQILLGEGGISSVEFFISDNASTDSTQEYMTKICEKYPFVGYFRNDENVGADNNFIKCLNRANGKYTLLLGDDDILLPGAVDAILKGIECEPVFALLNISGENLSKTETTIYTDVNRFIVDNYLISFISNMLYCTDLVKKVRLKKTYYELNYVVLAYETMKNDGIYMNINHPCVQSNLNLSISHYNPYKFFNALIELIEDLKNSNFDFEILEYWMQRFMAYSMPYILIFQRKNFRNQDYYSKQNLLNKIFKKYPDLFPIVKYILTCPLSELGDTKKNNAKIEKMRIEYLKEYCSQYDKIYIYGTGKCGNYVFEQLKKIDGAKNIVGVVISDGQKKEKFHDLPIHYVSELSKVDENFGIIVAMLYGFRNEVFFTLKSMNLLKQSYFCHWI